MHRLTHDPWRGLRAIAQQPFNSSPPHAAYVPLTQGQQVTILSPPFWVWLDHSLLTGTYMVAVTTFCPSTTTTTRAITDPSPSNSGYNNDDTPLPPQSDVSLLASSSSLGTSTGPHHSSDYQPTTAVHLTPHANAPSPATVANADMAFLGLVPLSVFMP